MSPFIDNSIYEDNPSWTITQQKLLTQLSKLENLTNRVQQGHSSRRMITLLRLHAHLSRNENNQKDLSLVVNKLDW